MVKRFFDIVIALLLLIFLFPIFMCCLLITTVDTKSNGIFLQNRIGRFGNPFLIYKLRSIQIKTLKISKWGTFIRKSKLDEFPQLINILKGDMSLVGPRPDIVGYYDLLSGEERKILKLRPGITSEAAIKYVNEDVILKSQENPLQYNDTILFPDKIKLNLAYYYNHTFLGDLKIIGRTVLMLFKLIAIK